MERTVRMASLNLLLTGRSTGAGPEEAIIVPSRGVRGATPAAPWVPYERPRAIGLRVNVGVHQGVLERVTYPSSSIQSHPVLGYKCVFFKRARSNPFNTC